MKRFEASRTRRSVVSKIAVLALVVVALAVSVFALTATNTVADSKGGAGSGDITGYAVNNVSYTLAANPENFAQVEFDLDDTAGDVQASLDGGVTWVSCSNAVNHWTCLTPGVAVSSAMTLQVVSAS